MAFAFSRHKHYADMRVILRRHSPNRWSLLTICEDDISAQHVMEVDEPTALARAQKLASWFDAELVVEKAEA